MDEKKDRSTGLVVIGPNVRGDLRRQRLRTKQIYRTA
jgi:hypothetical protein